MPNFDVHIQRSSSVDENDDFLAVVEAKDGRRFRLGILKPVLDVWREQVDNLDVEEMASRLAIDLLDQAPSADELDEGFLVTLDNGYATPLAAEQNIRNSGVMPFLARKYKGEPQGTSGESAGAES
jgi:hypothetical protein